MWTYAAGLSDDYGYRKWNCPCFTIPGPSPEMTTIVSQVM